MASTDEVNFPSKVLVFHAEEPGNPDSRAWFEAVASPSQLDELPEDAPETPHGDVLNPYFRRSTMKARDRSLSALNEFADKVFEELSVLQHNLEAGMVMADDETRQVVSLFGP